MSHHCDLCRRVCDCGYSKMECRFCLTCQKEMRDAAFNELERELKEDEKRNAPPKEDKTDATQL